jgi:hypothetical protein
MVPPRRAAPGKAQSSSGSKLVLPEPFAPATNVIVGRFNGTTGLTKERVFVAAGKNLFQPLSFEDQPSPGRMGHLLSDLEPLSSDLQRYSNTDRWQTRRRPALSEKTRVDHPFSYLAKEYLDSVLPVSWNLTVNVRRNRGRRNIVGPAF